MLPTSNHLGCCEQHVYNPIQQGRRLTMQPPKWGGSSSYLERINASILPTVDASDEEMMDAGEEEAVVEALQAHPGWTDFERRWR
jgi:hypothetical protein